MIFSLEFFIVVFCILLVFGVVGFVWWCLLR